METCNVFFSWQSDIKESKNFISDCLRQLPKKLKDIAIIEVDRDTRGLAGAPDIGDAIFMKIDKADIFVADVTIINGEWGGRKTPNPNVMLELGYAIKSLGWDRIILLYNKDYGNVESLPFDINHQRMLGYSLKDEKKAEARNQIICSISATICILRECGVLHGGKPEILSARYDLSKLLLEGMGRIQEYYKNKYLTAGMDITPKENFVVVTDMHIMLAETVKEFLTDTQYFQLTRLLHKLKLATLGNEEQYGWEFADEIAEEYFEPLYCEYGDRMLPLPTEQVLCQTFVELYRAVSGKDNLQYDAVRMIDDKRVFSDDGTWKEAYDRNGVVLCKGFQEKEGFTGYRSTREYDGEWILSRKNGQGCESADYMNRNRFGRSEVRCKGTWKDDKFIEGFIYSAILYKKDDGEFLIEKDEDGIVFTADQEYAAFLMDTCDEEKLLHYYLADIYLKDGEYQILDNSVRSLIEADVYR